MKTVEFFWSECNHCKRGFGLPILSDFSYGCFVFFGEKGSAYVYLEAINDSVWEEICSKILRLAGLKEFTRKDSERLHWVIAACADKINGQGFIPEPLCPSCKSQDVNYSRVKSAGVREISEATFQNFQSLPEAAKMEMLANLWRQFE